MNETLIRELTSDTLLLHQNLENPEKFGIKPSEPTLGTCSLEASVHNLEQANKLCTKLKKLNYNNLTNDQKLTYDIILENYSVSADTKDLLIYQELIAPTTGTHLNLPILFAEYTFRNKQEIDDYIKLLNDVPRYFKEIIEFEKIKYNALTFMSESSKNKVIEQCKSFIANTDSNIFLTSFDSKISKIKWLTSKEITSYKEQNQAAFYESIIPSYQTLIDELANIHGSTYTTSPYSTDLGKKYYEYLVKKETSSEESVVATAKLYDTYTAKYISELKELAKSNTLLAKVSTFSFKIANSNVTLNQVKENMKKDFPKAANVTFQVKKLDRSLEAMNVNGFYLIPPIDNFKENVIYINRANNENSLNLLSTICH